MLPDEEEGWYVRRAMTSYFASEAARRELVAQIDSRGYAVVQNLFSAEHLEWLRNQVESLCDQLPRGQGLLVRRNRVYGIRNVLDVKPELASVLTQVGLEELLPDLIGPMCGVVRLQYLDKPPEASWTLPWHRDRSIAVSPDGVDYRRQQVTTKAGVTHVEASPRLLKQMLAVRINLDAVTKYNGPLEVIVGSHMDPGAMGKFEEKPAHRNAAQITGGAGDVVLMRPLLLHRSGHTKEPHRGHRRMLHFECGPRDIEDGGLRWYWYRELV